MIHAYLPLTSNLRSVWIEKRRAIGSTTTEIVNHHVIFCQSQSFELLFNFIILPNWWVAVLIVLFHKVDGSDKDQLKR